MGLSIMLIRKSSWEAQPILGVGVDATHAAASPYINIGYGLIDDDPTRQERREVAAIKHRLRRQCCISGHC